MPKADDIATVRLSDHVVIGPRTPREYCTRRMLAVFMHSYAIERTSLQLFVCLEECYIYDEVGDDEGNPKDDSHVLYDTQIDEILQLDLERQNGNYVACLKPVKGWVFLPHFDAQYSLDLLNDIYKAKKQVRDQGDEGVDEEEIEELYGLIMQDTMVNYTGHAASFPANEDDDTLISDERRDFQNQRMTIMNEPPEFNQTVNELLEMPSCFRRHPSLIGITITRNLNNSLRMKKLK